MGYSVIIVAINTKNRNSGKLKGACNKICEIWNFLQNPAPKPITAFGSELRKIPNCVKPTPNVTLHVLFNSPFYLRLVLSIRYILQPVVGIILWYTSISHSPYPTTFQCAADTGSICFYYVSFFNLPCH